MERTSRRGLLAPLWALLLGVHAAAAAVPLPAAARADTPVAALAGEWATPAGVEVPLAMTWRSESYGFSLRWALGDAAATQAFFVPGPRENVYAGLPEAPGWMSWSKPEPVDPLREGPLVWARTKDDAVIVYRLDVAASGTFDLDRYECRLQGEELVVTMHRSKPGAEEELEAHLARKAAP